MSAGSTQGDQRPMESFREAPRQSDVPAGGEPHRVPASRESGTRVTDASPAPLSLIDSILGAAATAASRSSSNRAAEFLAETNPARALRIWLDESFPAGKLPTRQAVLSRLGRELAQIDRILAGQVNAILHHPRLQQLEASWRGLWLLTEQVEEAKEAAELDAAPPKFEIQLLTLSKRELSRDLNSAVEFDQSQIFRKIYEDGFGIAGGYPFGALIGDYQFTNHPEDLDTLAGMAGVAAASFAPFITAPSPGLIGLEDYCQLEQPIQLTKTYSQEEYIKWNSLRNAEDSRFVGLVLPRVLMRLPYENDGLRADGFRFQEEVEGPDRRRYLWGNAAYAFGSVLIRAFGACRWFADIRGVERGAIGGGLVTELPVHSFRTERTGIAIKSSVEVAINDFQEKELSLLGFVPLSHCNDTEYSVFYTNASLQKPKIYDDINVTANAKISSMLQYTLCASRFAHYLKVLARNKIGGNQEEKELERELMSWIGQYVAADAKAESEIKAQYPLREAQVEVREIPAKPGSFSLVVHLLPHFQLDGLTSSLRLSMQMTTPGGT